MTLTLERSHCSLTDQNKLGIASFANEFPNQGDLCEFMDIYHSNMDRKVALTQVISVIPVNGVVDVQGLRSKQANIDTQFSVTPRCSTRSKDPPVLLALDTIFYPQPCFDGTSVLPQ